MQDEQRPENESGYTNGAFGDSGSPIITKTYDENLKKSRHITISVYNGAAGPSTKEVPEESSYSTDIRDKCRMRVSKLNDGVMEWLHLVMNYERKCEENRKACKKDIDAN